MESNLRTRIQLLGLATLLGTSCTGWLLDWTGTVCEVDSDCAPNLVCGSDKKCVQKGSETTPDGSTPVGDTGTATAADTGTVTTADTGTVTTADTGTVTTADTGTVTTADTGSAGTPDGGPTAGDTGTVEPPDASGPQPASVHSCGASVCYQVLPGEPLAVAARSETDVWVVGRHGMVLHWDGFGWQPVDLGVTDDMSVVRLAGADYVLIASTSGKVFEKKGGGGFTMTHDTNGNNAWFGGWVDSTGNAVVVGGDKISSGYCEGAYTTGGSWTEPMCKTSACQYSGVSRAIDGQDFQTLILVGDYGYVFFFNSDSVPAPVHASLKAPNPRTDRFRSIKVFGEVQFVAGKSSANADQSFIYRCSTADKDAGALLCQEVGTKKPAYAVWGSSAATVWIAGPNGYLGRTLPDGGVAETLVVAGVPDELIAIDGFATDGGEGVVAVGSVGATGDAGGIPDAAGRLVTYRP